MEEVKHIVYIVDDSEIICSITERVVSQYPGVTVFSFHSGEAAVEHLSIVTPTVAIIDYFLAHEGEDKMNGNAVHKALLQKNPHLFSILLTGVSDPQHRDQLQQAGFQKVIFKEQEDVFEQISAAMASLFTSK